MPPDSRRITDHKAANARVVRLEDALLAAMDDEPPTGSPGEQSEQVRKLRHALREAYAQRELTQHALFPTV